MASVSIVKIKIRRGTDSERRRIVLDNGELGYVTDPGGRRLFIGDGLIPGGYPVGSILFYNVDLTVADSYKYAQVGDIIYDTASTKLYTVTNVDYSNPSPLYTFKFIGPSVDNTSVQYNIAGNLTVNLSGVNGNSLPITNPGAGSKKLWNDGGIVKVA